MKRMERLTMLLLTFTSTATLTLAQSSQNGDPAAACGVMGCGIVIWLVAVICMLAFSVGLIIFLFRWIKRDATARGMPNASTVAWFSLLGLLGLVIYLLQRPQGNVMPCPSCGLNRMQGLPICPNCGKP